MQHSLEIYRNAHLKFNNKSILSINPSITNEAELFLVSNLPRHILGPSPNGIKLMEFRLLIASSANLSGLNSSGFGNIHGSLYIANVGTITSVSFGMVTLVPAKVYGSEHFRVSRKPGGYNLRVSRKNRLYFDNILTL